MKEVLRQMLRIYKPISQLDWMNYKLKKEDVTFHHIIKAEHQGKKTIDNGCILMPVSHQYLHLIECLDIETYNVLNEMFKKINTQGYEPTIEQREIIESILQEFENNHRWDKGYGGKLLIKKKYLSREYKK